MHEFVSANSEPLQKWWTVKLINKIKKPSWVKWVHISKGESHCETCLRLDGCWFSEDNTTKIPQHPHCHCNLEPIDFELVEEKAVYFAAVGGAGALYSGAVKRCEVIAFDELGCESVKKLTVKDFPVTVAIDSFGNSLFER